MRGFTVRSSSCPTDKERARRRARQEAFENGQGEALARAVVDESRSALDAYVFEGARQLLQMALECEVQGFLEEHADKVDERGRRQVVRNGYLPARTILTGAGPLEIEQPRVRDKTPHEGGRAVFTSAIEELLPWLYLKGV
jgi:putative transposase